MTAPKILVIDDETAVQKAIQKSLKNLDYELFFASNGKEGLKLIKKLKPSLVFLDLKMPVMDGVEFLKTVKLKHDTPYHVVVITGHGEEEDITKCYKLGAHSFLRKPLSMTEITSLTDRCIMLKDIEAELTAHREKLEDLVAKKTKKITEQLEFQQTLIDSIPTPIYFKDMSQKIIGTNKAFRTFFNVTENKIHGKLFSTFMSASTAKKEKIKDEQILQSGRSQNYQVKITAGKDKKYDVVFNKAVFKDQKGNIKGVIGAIFDVTEREAAMAKLAEKSQSLNQANMSLRILIKQLSDAQNEERHGNLPNLKELVMPNSEQLGSILSSPSERAYLENIMLNLNRVTSPFAKELSQLNLGLSPKEIQVADLIRIGLSNKESAIQMNVTKSTVEFHRDNLRKKLGLKHKKKNLRAYLMALEAKLQKKR